jgi:hypothetical protein
MSLVGTRTLLQSPRGTICLWDSPNSQRWTICLQMASKYRQDMDTQSISLYLRGSSGRLDTLISECKRRFRSLHQSHTSCKTSPQDK